MSYYLKEGEILWPTTQGAFDVRDKLPVGTYTVKSSIRGFFLQPIDDFAITGKIYGKTSGQAERILNTFQKRPNATGVLLNGEKGSGKTMLAKLISEEGAKQGISTLVINTPFTGDSFNTFIQSIDEPCIIVFDEFEKVFDEAQQEATLTLLDGVYPTKKLFILTVNDKYRVNQHMRNRPGRIFYMIDYKGLDSQFIEEYCQDNLNDKSYIPVMSRLTMMFDSFNFDMLKALVEEMNRYNESPNQALEMLNAKPFSEGNTRHDLRVVFPDQTEFAAESIYPAQIRGNPLIHDELNVEVYKSDEDRDNDISTSLCVTPRDLLKIDPDKGTFTFLLNRDTDSQAVVVFTRQASVKAGPNWLDVL